MISTALERAMANQGGFWMRMRRTPAKPSTSMVMALATTMRGWIPIPQTRLPQGWSGRSSAALVGLGRYFIGRERRLSRKHLTRLPTPLMATPPTTTTAMKKSMAATLEMSILATLVSILESTIRSMGRTPRMRWLLCSHSPVLAKRRPT